MSLETEISLFEKENRRCVSDRSSLSILFLITAATSLVLAQPGINSNPGVLPPNSSPHGNTYTEWNAPWWK